MESSGGRGRAPPTGRPAKPPKSDGYDKYYIKVDVENEIEGKCVNYIKEEVISSLDAKHLYVRHLPSLCPFLPHPPFQIIRAE